VVQLQLQFAVALDACRTIEPTTAALTFPSRSAASVVGRDE
jgi:hypothetical protein